MKNKYVKFLLKHKVAVLGILAGVLALGLGFSMYKYKTDIANINTSNAEQLQALSSQISANSRTGYVATAEIRQGDILQEGVNIAAQQFSSSADQSIFATAECAGKQAAVDIAAGTPITTNITATVMDNQRNERECTFINLSANLKKGDFVDVRVLFPNGEDYIVVPKVSLQNPVISSNLVYLWLTEDQNLNLDGAIVDANLHNAIIYTTKYIQPTVQPANIVTYQPNAAIISLMQSNPNIVQESVAALSVSARESIEDRLAAFEEAYPDFKLEVNASEDVSAALKAISDAAAAGSAATDAAGADTNTGATSSGTDAGANTDANAGADANTGANSSDATVTYGD